jgi:hypothetical protein
MRTKGASSAVQPRISSQLTGFITMWLFHHILTPWTAEIVVHGVVTKRALGVHHELYTRQSRSIGTHGLPVGRCVYLGRILSL